MIDGSSRLSRSPSYDIGDYGSDPGGNMRGTYANAERPGGSEPCEGQASQLILMKTDHTEQE